MGCYFQDVNYFCEKIHHSCLIDFFLNLSLCILFYRMWYNLVGRLRLQITFFRSDFTRSQLPRRTKYKCRFFLLNSRSRFVLRISFKCNSPCKIFHMSAQLRFISFALDWNISPSFFRQMTKPLTEEVAQRCFVKKVFLEILQNSQENT